MTPQSQDESRLALSPRLILGLLLGSALVTFLLLPNERTLIERHMRDGSFDKALKLSQDVRPAKRDRSPVFFKHAELRCRRGMLSGQNLPEQLKLLEQNLAAYSQFQFADEFFVEILTLSSNLASEPGLQPMLKPVVDRMPSQSKRILTETLVPLFLAHGQTLAAAKWYSDYWRTRPHGEQEVLEMVKLWRFSENPANALQAVDSWLPGATNLTHQTRRHFDDLRIELLREQNLAEDAFRATKKLYTRSSSQERDELFPLLTETALGSGNAEKVLPEMMERAKRRPDDSELWRAILDLSVAGGDLKVAVDACTELRRLHPQDSLIILKQAQLHEWRENETAAFDAYRDALKLGEHKSLHRLLALNEGLYRDAELADLLEAYPEIARGKVVALQVARLLARANKFESAKTNYTYVVEQSPGKLEPVLEYGSFLSALFDYEEALALFETASRMDPGNETLKRRVAETHVMLARPDNAIRVYEELIPTTADDELLNQIVVLAESAGKLDTVRSAIRRKLSIGKKITPADYLRLDYFETLAGSVGLAAEAVLEGVARFPEDESLRLQAGYTLSAAKRYKDATEVLKDHKSIKTNPAILQLYLSLLILGQRYGEASLFVSEGIAPEHLGMPGILELRAQIEEVEKRLPNAIALMAQLREKDAENIVYAMNHARLLSLAGRVKEAIENITPHLNTRRAEILKLAAQVFSAGGEHRKAELFQRAYLATDPEELPQARGFLGDIYLSRGSKIEAKRAYTRGLQELLDGIRAKKQTH